MQCPYLDEIHSLSNIIALFAWSLAALMLTRAVFGSMPAAALRTALFYRMQEPIRRAQLLRWELKHGIKQTPEIRNAAPNAARIELSQDALDERRYELRKIESGMLWFRIVNYGMTCFACQSFWVSLAIIVTVNGFGRFGVALLTALAYSGGCLIVSKQWGISTETEIKNTGPTRSHGSCKGGGCG